MLQKLKEKKVADEKQRLVDEQRKSIADRQKMDKDRRDKEDRTILLGKSIVETLNNLGNHSFGSQFSSTKTVTGTGQLGIPNTEETIPTINLSSSTNELKSTNVPQPGSIDGPAMPENPEVTPKAGNNLQNPIKKKPGFKSIIDDIIDLINF